jgi:predicted RNA-binding Zn-ribbon protein involved in translation (DUF1610 family)
MSSDACFKIRSTKRSTLETRTTLDAIHQQQLASLQDKMSEIDTLRGELAVVKDALNVAIDQDNTGAIFEYEKQKKGLEAKINRLEKKEDLYDYYLNTGNILFEYYNIQDRISEGATVASSIAAKARPGSIFAALEEAAAQETTATTPSPPPAVREKTDDFSREKLLDRYLKIVDPSIAKSLASETEDTWSECRECGAEMMFSMNEAFVECPKCGNQEQMLIDSDKPSYKDPPREVSYYAYKRINHFNEWLAQFQAKESTEIPAEIFDAILMELKKERITNMASIKQTKLREILKKLKLNKYYEHIPHILNRLNGQTAPVMSRDNEEKLRHMFKEIQPSFQKHCPADRSNFLSYSYVLYKFCELLELDDFLPCFPLLKNRDKLYAQDRIWQKICEDMSWEYIRTL